MLMNQMEREKEREARSSRKIRMDSGQPKYL